jgi:O-antigen/teichoic acid export membrane protein
LSLKKNTLWNLFGSIAPVAIGALTVPYLIKNIGLEAFGILTLVWAMIGYFSLFDFGLGRVLTLQIAAFRGSGAHDQLPSLIKTGLLITIVTGIIGGALLAMLSGQLGRVWLNVSQAMQPIAVQSLIIAAIGIPLATLTAGLRGVLEADERFGVINQHKLILGFANFGLPALSVYIFGPRLDLIVLSLVIARLVVLFAHFSLVNRVHTTCLRARILNRTDAFRLVKSGSFMTVSNIVSPLMVVSDRFFISNVLGAGMVAFYTVPFEVLFRMLMLPAAFTTSLFPRLAALNAADDLECSRLYKKGVYLVGSIMLPVCFIAACGSYWFLKFWISVEFAEKSWLIASTLSLGVFFNSVAQVPFAALHAAGRVRATAILHSVEFIIYIPLMFVALRLFGVVGAACMWTIRAGCDLAALYLCARNLVRSKAEGFQHG